MGIFNRLFGFKKQTAGNKRSKYLPEEKDPVALEFAKKFTQRGGKFIHCDTPDEVFYYFNQILLENNWSREAILCNSPVLSSFFKLSSSAINPEALLIGCEYLIANKGSILICNRQIQEKKLAEIPVNLIIVAKTSDFSPDVSAAMTAINQKYKDQLPTNITTLNAFDPTKENDFLSYGGNAKHLYLLLQEVNG